MIKHPTEFDFEVEVSEAAIDVIFKPTRRHFTYTRFIEHKDMLSLAPCHRTHVYDMTDGILALIDHPRFKRWRFA